MTFQKMRRPDGKEKKQSKKPCIKPLCDTRGKSAMEGKNIDLQNR
jgi:hypothetical protein